MNPVPGPLALRARSCTTGYRTRARDLARLEPQRAEVAYIIGGLYGNLEALDAIEELAARETAAGGPAPLLCFNGDFHWFDASPEWFAEIQRRVLVHRPCLGNVEMELADPQPGAGCGCNYPRSVPEDTVSRSDAIMARLQRLVHDHSLDVSVLRPLPRQLRVEVGPLRVGVVHGDPDNIAGWGLELAAMPPPGSLSATLETWFDEADVDVLASSHTCRCFAQAFPGSRAVFNNGAAGMPNFTGDHRIVITRIARRPPTLPAGSEVLYARDFGSITVSALALPWDRETFLRRFDRVWPAGSPAAQSYRQRIRRGPPHIREEAKRLAPSADQRILAKAAAISRR
ncbi:putative metallophosphoesterase [Thioalkalivibrio nitratireducens DSM 14787]|uniref:Metallophosphoesterase n=1 Tax=Thioalkalivibrio nitratireducens (strain DSM 14787 / UNIQEM 213 / ALEN2) TaxID=1255043 RepID=L0DUK8_THIND|nr:putative metallophosphoesterase [Thioalkalivibrio nitratireducens]AGA32687.1 putative metallophosphoesterase [Thioalkalivibrio nitratireducens DSM 14787]